VCGHVATHDVGGASGPDESPAPVAHPRSEAEIASEVVAVAALAVDARANVADTDNCMSRDQRLKEDDMPAATKQDQATEVVAATVAAVTDAKAPSKRASSRASKKDARVRRPAPEDTPKGQHWCSAHKAFHPVKAFGKNRSEKSGLMSMCKDADREIQRAWRKKKAQERANAAKEAK
jgi:hypothetical protein